MRIKEKVFEPIIFSYQFSEKPTKEVRTLQNPPGIRYWKLWIFCWNKRRKVENNLFSFAFGNYAVFLLWIFEYWNSNLGLFRGIEMTKNNSLPTKLLSCFKVNWNKENSQKVIHEGRTKALLCSWLVLLF